MAAYNEHVDWSPLAYGDPVPGNTDKIAALGHAYAQTATAIQEASQALKNISDSQDGSSRAVMEFKSLSGTTGADLEKAHDRYSTAASALTSYAQELGAIQARAMTALDLAQRAEDDRKTAENQKACLVPSESGNEAERERIDHQLTAYACDLSDQQRALRAITSEYDALGDKAAKEIEGGFEDGLKDNFWEKIAGVLAQLAKFTDLIAGWVGLLALVLAWVPVLGQVLAIVALVAGAISLVAKLVNLSTGTATWGDVLLAAVGVFGGAIGRGLSTVLKGGITAVKGVSAVAAVGRAGSALGGGGRAVANGGIGRLLSSAGRVAEAGTAGTSQAERLLALAGNPFRTMAAGFSKPFKTITTELRDLGYGEKVFSDDWFEYLSPANLRWKTAWDGGKGLIPTEIKNFTTVAQLGRDADFLAGLSATQGLNLYAMTRIQDLAFFATTAGKIKFIMSGAGTSDAH